MLAADPAHRGLGVGRELVRFAERKSRAEGLRRMQLELLVPRRWTHPTKVFLDAWYTRIGYRVARTGAVDEAYPALAPLLATPYDLVIYRKRIDTGPASGVGFSFLTSSSPGRLRASAHHAREAPGLL
jgi:Acetyltransferase (GNAT) family